MNKLYIPGDLVYFGGEKAKVELYNPSADDSVWVRVIENGGENRTWNASLKYEISPIPITPEILEKNGWVKDTHRHCLDEMPAEAYEKKDFPLTHFNVTFGKKRIQASHDCLFVRNLKYVSDLQHLLFGLGLSSEMEV